MDFHVVHCGMILLMVCWLLFVMCGEHGFVESLNFVHCACVEYSEKMIFVYFSDEDGLGWMCFVVDCGLCEYVVV